MFPLFHDRTRRLICRVLFLLFGLAPTGALIAWSAVVNGNGYRAATCDRIAASLGAEVRASDVYHPRQEITVLQRFEIYDAETGAALFHSPRVEIHRGEQLQTIEAERAEIKLSGHNWWLPLVERRLRLIERPPLPVRLHASEIALAWPGGKQTLHDFTVEVTSSAEGNAAVAKFQFGDGLTSERVEWQFRRTSRNGKPTSTLALQTGTAAIPCSLLAAALQRDNPLGTASTFRGKLEMHEGPQGWEAEIADGRLEQVDLSSLVRHHFAGDCTGTATISLPHALIRQGEAVEMQGVIEAGSGTVSGPVFNALRFSLGLRSLPNWNPPATVSFDQLAAEFDLTSAGLTIMGRCDAPPEGMILRAANQPLLTQPGYQLPPWWRW